MSKENNGKPYIDLDVSEEQGKLFEMSVYLGLDSVYFIKKFMESDICAEMDNGYTSYLWAGYEYIMCDFCKDKNNTKYGGNIYNQDVMFWIGYLYRYWHYYTGESGKEIYKQVDGETLIFLYPAYHTFDPEMAIDRIKEANLDK